jgi:hypothetical protein
MFMRPLLLLTLTGLLSCDQGEPPQAAAPIAAAPSDVFTNTRPANAADLAEVKAAARTGDTVTFLARVGGKRAAFVEGSAIFLAADPKLISCELMSEEDHCEKPWDYCCEDADAITAGLATVQLVDAAGNVLKTSAKGQGGLEALKFVVVEGVVRDRNDEGLFIVDASRIWVGGKPDRSDPRKGSGG